MTTATTNPATTATTNPATTATTNPATTATTDPAPDVAPRRRGRPLTGKPQAPQHSVRVDDHTWAHWRAVAAAQGCPVSRLIHLAMAELVGSPPEPEPLDPSPDAPTDGDDL